MPKYYSCFLILLKVRLVYIPPPARSLEICSSQRFKTGSLNIPDRSVIGIRERHTADQISFRQRTVSVTRIYHRKHFRIARTAVFRPCFDSQREDSDPFLHDDAFEVALLNGLRIAAVRRRFPRNGDFAPGRCAVVAQRIGIGCRLLRGVDQIGVGPRCSPLLERKSDSLLIERLRRLGRSPAQFVLCMQEGRFRGIEP